MQVQAIYKHPKYRGAWFTVKCDCGNVLNVALAKLKQNHVKSCGCIRRKHDQLFISEIDGEKIIVSGGKLQYFRILDSREQLHVYEAKKLFRLTNSQWDNCMVVHHVDGNKLNNSLTNLAVISDNGLHQKHHNQMERQMYKF